MNEWRCSECGCTVRQALEKRARSGGPEFTVRSRTCAPTCRARRQARLAQRRAQGRRTLVQRKRLEKLRATRLTRQALLVRMAARPDGELYRFALNLRSLRKSAGLTVSLLARRAGISNGYVPMMEAAKLRALPSREVLRRVAAALGTTPARLCGRGR